MQKKNNKLKSEIIAIKNEQEEKQIIVNQHKKKEYIISKVIDMCKNINL